ncbi:hypothetical protein [Chondromyces crocatus]|uniref:Uncharacterized protein n=1 Tax=Chondromyces crocatus TaxID=52 RepID=A0A0K1EKQ6_CHOCO|nr:hypothetical protein [Chondromyces crocatus]AKT41445.1 uncharacterized protein CMC5_056480 [Chondromyces crocatus]
MSVDITPHVFLEVKTEEGWVPLSPRTMKPSKRSTRIDVKIEESRASFLLMLACNEACPKGATFSDAHEKEFQRFFAQMREVAAENDLPLDEDEIFGAGALTEKKLRTLAEGPSPEDSPYEPRFAEALWDEARKELLRWADTLKGTPKSRVVYWFEPG